MKHNNINVVFMALLAMANSAPAQGVNRQLAEGTHLFRRILHDADLKSVPLKSLRGLDARERQDVRYEALHALLREPEGKILIVLGETRFLDPRILDDFLNNGGALLLATDRPTPDTLYRLFGMGVSGNAVSVRDDSPSAYLSQGECVYVESVNKGDGLFEDLPRLATNRPSYLDLIHARLRPLQLLALFPKETLINGRSSRNRLPFAAGGDWEAGRVLLLADHSIFINAMLWQNDNDNLFFAQNCARWLADGKRTEVLFIEDGEVQTHFDIPLKPPPFPPLDGLVGAVDQGLQSLEEEDRFNRLTRGSIEDLDPDKVLRGLVMVLTLGAGLYGLSRLSQTRHHFETRAPLLEDAARTSVSSLELYEQRERALLRQGNFLEAARGLIRAEFDKIVGPGLAAKRIPDTSPDGGWWTRWRRRQQVRRLWHLAYGAHPRRVSGKRLAGLEQELGKLRANLI